MNSKDLKEEKEQLLLQIEGTATWRASKAEEHPNDAKRNWNAHYKLLQLYDYVNNLPEDHPIFKHLRAPFTLSDDEDIDQTELTNIGEKYSEELNNEIRMFGFQNQQTPREFIEETLMKIGKQSK
jgi:hypothetical protein